MRNVYGLSADKYVINGIGIVPRVPIAPSQLSSGLRFRVTDTEWLLNSYAVIYGKLTFDVDVTKSVQIWADRLK